MSGYGTPSSIPRAAPRWATAPTTPQRRPSSTPPVPSAFSTSTNNATTGPPHHHHRHHHHHNHRHGSQSSGGVHHHAHEPQQQPQPQSQQQHHHHHATPITHNAHGPSSHASSHMTPSASSSYTPPVAPSSPHISTQHSNHSNAPSSSIYDAQRSSFPPSSSLSPSNLPSLLLPPPPPPPASQYNMTMPNSTSSVRAASDTASAGHSPDTVPRAVPVMPPLDTDAHAPLLPAQASDSATPSATSATSLRIITNASPPTAPQQLAPSSPSSALSPTSTNATAPINSNPITSPTASTAAQAAPHLSPTAPSVASATAIPRASPAPSSSSRLRTRLASSTATPPPGRAGSPYSTRGRASSEMRSSAAPESAVAAGTSVNGARPNAVASSSKTAPAPAAASATASTAAGSGTTTPADGAPPKKKTKRRGWKGWAIEVEDEFGNKYIRSPSPEPAIDPNAPRRRRGRPRKSETPAVAAGAAAPRAPASTAAGSETQQDATAAQQGQAAEAANGASAETVEAQPLADTSGAMEDGANNGTPSAAGTSLSPAPAPTSDLTPEPAEEPPAPESPEPEPKPRRQPMSRWSLGPKRPRDSTEPPTATKRFRPSRGKTPPSYTEPPDIVMDALTTSDAAAPTRQDTPARRGPGRPRKSESVKPAGTPNGDVADAETPSRATSVLRATRGSATKNKDKDNDGVHTRSSPPALRDATPASVSSSRLSEPKAPRSGPKSTVPSAQPQQRTLDDYVMTGEEEQSSSSKTTHTASSGSAYPSPPVSDERQESTMRRKRTSSGSRSGQEQQPSERKLPNVLEEAEMIIASSKAYQQRREQEGKQRDDDAAASISPVLETARPSASPVMDVQEHQERSERRGDRQEMAEGRHQERDSALQGKLRSREIQDHELRARSSAPHLRESSERDRRRDDQSVHFVHRRDSARFEESARYDPRGDPRIDHRDGRDRRPIDPHHVNGHYRHGPSYPPSHPYNYPHHHPQSSQYGYQPGFYPAPLPQAPPHLHPQHAPPPHNYSYGPPITSPREHQRNLAYDGSPRIQQDEWAYRGPPPPRGYPVPARPPTAPAAPPPLSHPTSSSRRPPTHHATQPPPNRSLVHPHLPPMQLSPTAPSAQLREELSRSEGRGEMRRDSRSERDYRDHDGDRERVRNYARDRELEHERGRSSRERQDGITEDRTRSRDREEPVVSERDRERQLEREREAQQLYTNVVPTPFPTGPPYRPPEPRPPKLEGRQPAIILAPPGNALPLPTTKSDIPYAKAHARGFEGLEPNLEENARGFVENVKNNLRALVGTYFVEPSAARDAFLERIGRDLTELGWGLTDASDGALYSRGGVQRPSENDSRERVRELSREWRLPARSGRRPPSPDRAVDDVE